MKLYAISDIHTDFIDNFNLIKKIGNYPHDSLIIAGDISDNLDIINKTFDLLQNKFKYVFYTPGNHELWTRNYRYSSLHKLDTIINLCSSRGIITKPHKFQAHWIIPLFSWYHCKIPLDNNTIIPEWADYYLCEWPLFSMDLAEYFGSLNKQYLKSYEDTVISFSHFLPTAKLLPNPKYLKFKKLPDVSVSTVLAAQIKLIGSKIHIFGHSHINHDTLIDNVRYIQNALRYPRERKKNVVNLKLVLEIDE
ncbi:MAG: metallophosphoesterase [Symploca sp. SIO1C2]|nr:metallophosphoesterase [Symploca sp. SIO1C2]NER49718.1 metallophosphoesterase [Symploca sp. SIO1A3]